MNAKQKMSLIETVPWTIQGGHFSGTGKFDVFTSGNTGTRQRVLLFVVQVLARIVVGKEFAPFGYNLFN